MSYKHPASAAAAALRILQTIGISLLTDRDGPKIEYCAIIEVAAQSINQ